MKESPGICLGVFFTMARPFTSFLRHPHDLALLQAFLVLSFTSVVRRNHFMWARERAGGYEVSGNLC
jgi:hypothetical protein